MLVHSTDNTAIEKYKAIHGVVRRIPEGKVATYGQIAAVAGLPGRARLAGKALGTLLNQQAIPWHRVLRSDGRIAFAADTEQGQLQKRLLEDEGVALSGMRVKLKIYQWEPESLW